MGVYGIPSGRKCHDGIFNAHGPTVETKLRSTQAERPLSKNLKHERKLKARVREHIMSSSVLTGTAKHTFICLRAHTVISNLFTSVAANVWTIAE